MAGEELIYEASPEKGPLRQGEIVSNLVQAHLTIESIESLFSGSTPRLEISPKTHPFAIITTQDCDLEQDFKARSGDAAKDKLLPNIMFCEMFTADELRDKDWMVGDLWKRIPQNKDERYHFFQRIQPEMDALKKGLPELAVDFKRYFTVPADEVYVRLKSEIQRRCVFRSPYLEHFSTRFSYFQFRIALPQDHFSEPGDPKRKAGKKTPAPAAPPPTTTPAEISAPKDDVKPPQKSWLRRFLGG